MSWNSNDIACSCCNLEQIFDSLHQFWKIHLCGSRTETGTVAGVDLGVSTVQPTSWDCCWFSSQARSVVVSLLMMETSKALLHVTYLLPPSKNFHISNKPRKKGSGENRSHNSPQHQNKRAASPGKPLSPSSNASSSKLYPRCPQITSRKSRLCCPSTT
jgi:hypothetical protein